ncbi:MAG: S9 family peptidase, partial [Brevundimonas sp.]|nr:S9 family peptidase [Brevundimonas sp.]
MIRTSMLALAAALALGGFAEAQDAAPATLADINVTRATAPTIEQMAAYPSISGFNVSPDGKHIAALGARGDEQVIMVWDMERPNEQPTVIGASQMRIRGVTFVKDNVLGVSLWQRYDSAGGGTTKIFLSKFMLTDLDGRDWRDPMSVMRTRSESDEEYARLASPQLLDRLPNDPENILLSIGA